MKPCLFFGRVTVTTKNRFKFFCKQDKGIIKGTGAPTPTDCMTHDMRYVQRVKSLNKGTCNQVSIPLFLKIHAYTTHREINGSPKSQVFDRLHPHHNEQLTGFLRRKLNIKCIHSMSSRQTGNSTWTWLAYLLQ